MLVRVAAVQLNSTAEKASNLAAADRLTRAAAADGATLIVLPEKWTAIGSEEELREAAEPLEDRARDQVDAELAGDRARPSDRRPIQGLCRGAQLLV